MGPASNFSADDFHLGATVYSSDGREIGTLRRVLVDSTDYELKAVVVKETHSFSGHLLSPGSMVLVDEVESIVASCEVRLSTWQLPPPRCAGSVST